MGHGEDGEKRRMKISWHVVYGSYGKTSFGTEKVLKKRQHKGGERREGRRKK